MIDEKVQDVVRSVAALKRQKNPLLKAQLAERAIESAVLALHAMAAEISALKRNATKRDEL